jgi:3-hydroxyisobutyrate dehydrogenase
MRLGFVGTGTMGAAMAECLIDAGHDLTIYDIRPEATVSLTTRGASAADSPAGAAVLSEVVFTSLPGPAEVELAVLDPSSGILAGLRVGSVYIDTTTNAPGVARRVAEACRARGVDVLDAPVSGRPPGMKMMVGGDASVFAKYCSRRWRGISFMSAMPAPAALPSWSRSI